MPNEQMKTLTVNNQVRFDIIDAEAREKLKTVVKTINRTKPDEEGNIDVPMVEKVSQLENDKSYATEEFVAEAIANAGVGTQSSVIKLTNESGFIAKSVSAGNKVELAFKFTSEEDGVATGDGSCQVSANSVVKSTFNIKQGETITVDVTDYLKAGTNNIKIKCSDVYGNYRTLNFTITMVDLRITSTFDDTIPYTGVIQFKYIPYGALEKTIYIVADGQIVHENTVTTSGKQVTANLLPEGHGIHRIEAYMTATLDGSEIESNHLVYEAMVVTEGSTGVLISSVYEKTEITQGEQVSIPYIVYDPSALSAAIELIISSNGTEYSKKAITVDRTRQYWNVRDFPVGDVSFTIKCGEAEKTYTVAVAEADIDVEPVTNDLELYLTSKDRSNREENPAQWGYGDVTTTFTNVNWDSTGWGTDENGDSVLRLNGGATAEIAFQPFAADFKTYGKTLEFEYAIRDVNNRDAVVISCMSGNIGLEMTADRATLKSQQSEIFCNYNEEEKVRVSFVVESRSEYRLMQVYLNGVLSGAKQYPANDNFQQTTPVNITIGSAYCGVDVYNIRSYTNALTFNEIIDNYIADISDMTEKVTAYEDNDLYDEYGNLSYEAIKDKIPVMTIIGDLPQSKGDKKDVVVKFEHNINSSLSFEDTASIDVQGTSSQWYIRKNYKEKTANKHIHAVGQMPTAVFCTKADYAESTGTHNTQNANLVETLYSEKTPAQEDDSRCRTTIFGYPIVIFHQTTEDAEPEFIGKYNFNFDKGSEEVYGFNGEYDVESWEFLNNTSDQCNFLATIGAKWDTDFEARYPDGHKDISRFKTMHNWVVSTKGNVAKFKREFENYFDLHYSLIYYVYTSVMLMVDQRAKNMFLTYWAETGKWQPWFYDNDTCLGINNEGHLVFDYYHEDIDTLDGANVYNGQNSTLWNNFRQAFADEIQECYQLLRNDKKLTYEKVIEHFIENGSKKWSASIYNEDSDYKYISMLRSDNDASNLYQIRGNGESHLKYFVANRLKYLDSKWYASDYAKNYVTLRIYTPAEWAGVEPNADITIVPFSAMYAGVRYKANGTLQQVRVAKNEEITFEAPNETFNDTETAIYGASEISSLGDLAPLYCGTINVANASRLVTLKIGDRAEGYVNNNLKELTVGTNKLLKVIDVRNCPSLVSPLALSGCPNIEEIYATGSGITGVELANSGYLKKIHLPGTITDLTLKNQLYINDLQVTSYDNVATLNIENCPTLDELDILEKCTNIERVRLTNVNWRFDDVSFLLGLVQKGIKGVDENGLNVDIPQISGTAHIEEMTGADMAEVKAYFPYLTITYTKLAATVTFKDENETVLATVISINGASVEYPGAAPTKESTAQYTFVHSGWTLEPGGEAVPGILDNVTMNITVYPAFTATLRSYTIRFIDGTTVYQSSQVDYGEVPVYTGEEPTKTDYTFLGWTPTLVVVTCDADYVAMFKSTKSQTRAYIDNTITDFSNNVVTIIGKNMFQNYSTLIQVDCPNVTFIDDFAFYNTSNLTTINFPKAENTGNWAFQNCGNLTTISFPMATSIGAESFRVCVKLPKADFPMATSIGTRAFYGCSALTTLILRSETMCTITSSDALESTPIKSGTGYIYVPSALVDSYKSATNWSNYANQFRAIEDYPEICGGV